MACRLNTGQKQNNLPYWYTTNSDRISSGGSSRMRVFCRFGGGLNASCLVGRCLGDSESGRLPRTHLFNVRLLRTNPNARGKVIRFDFNQWRDNLLTSLNHLGAASVEAAALRRIDGRGHVALKHNALAHCLNLWIRHGHRRNQGSGIRH